MGGAVKKEKKKVEEEEGGFIARWEFASCALREGTVPVGTTQ